jgi:hypothetical protein
MKSSLSISLLSASLLFGACTTAPKEVPPTQIPTAPTSAPAAVGGSTVASAHGGGSAAAPAVAPPQTKTPVKWTAPARWTTGPEKPMRAATYLIPAAAGDAEGAECAVFANIGGGVQANLDRWVGQFELPGGGDPTEKAKTSKQTINGLTVTTIDLLGTYKGGGVAMGQASTPKTGYRLLGAIVEGQSGPGSEVFFKMTGPVKTMAVAEKEFQTLLKSLAK